MHRTHFVSGPFYRFGISVFVSAPKLYAHLNCVFVMVFHFECATNFSTPSSVWGTECRNKKRNQPRAEYKENPERPQLNGFKLAHFRNSN